MNKVYLAGGMRSGWQNQVKEISGLIFYDPREKELGKTMSVNEFGTWDLLHIKKADIFFVYIEKTNTSCIGAAVEVGYAAGLGKTVILVLEENHETIPDKYLAFFTKAANVVFNNLDNAIEYLQAYC